MISKYTKTLVAGFVLLSLSNSIKAEENKELFSKSKILIEKILSAEKKTRNINEDDLDLGVGVQIRDQTNKGYEIVICKNNNEYSLLIVEHILIKDKERKTHVFFDKNSDETVDGASMYILSANSLFPSKDYRFEGEILNSHLLEQKSFLRNLQGDIILGEENTKYFKNRFQRTIDDLIEIYNE